MKNHRAKRRLRKAVNAARRRIAFDRDLWSGETIAKATAVVEEALAALRRGTPAELAALANDFDARFSAVTPPRRRFAAAMCDWLDVFAVVGAVAFGIRGLFFQPFVIPTGSMQPTLFGVHYLKSDSPWRRPDSAYPALWNQLAYSASHVTATAKGGAVSVKGAEGDGLRKVEEFLQTLPPRRHPEGEVLADGFISGGDGVFVERFSHLFHELERGDIVVFNTSGLTAPDGRKLSDLSGFYYIKRLAGLPGDTLRISDGVLYIKPAGETEFRRADELSEKFAKLFSGRGGFHGYTNSPQMKHLAGKTAEFTVPPDGYFMLGDNSESSLDSRYWGVVPRENIVGRALVVFWPFSRRWGGMDAPPLPIPTEPDSMNMQ